MRLVTREFGAVNMNSGCALLRNLIQTLPVKQPVQVLVRSISGKAFENMKKGSKVRLSLVLGWK